MQDLSQFPGTTKLINQIVAPPGELEMALALEIHLVHCPRMYAAGVLFLPLPTSLDCIWGTMTPAQTSATQITFKQH